MNKLKEAFDEVRATDGLKKNTAEFISREMSKRGRKPAVFRYASAVCAVILVAVLGFAGYSLFTSPVSAISIDVNPSIELELNIFNRVVSASAFNDDGKLIMENVDVGNMEYTEAVGKILSDDTFNGYINEDSLLVITVASDKGAEIISGIESSPAYAKIAGNAAETKVEEAEKETITQAHDCGLSFGKYQAYTKLRIYDESVTPEAVASMSMREIRDRIEELSGESVSMNELKGGHNSGSEASSCDSSQPENCENDGNGKGTENGNGGGQKNGEGNGSGNGTGGGKGYKGGR